MKSLTVSRCEGPCYPINIFRPYPPCQGTWSAIRIFVTWIKGQKTGPLSSFALLDRDRGPIIPRTLLLSSFFNCKFTSLTKIIMKPAKMLQLLLICCIGYFFLIINICDLFFLIINFDKIKML